MELFADTLFPLIAVTIPVALVLAVVWHFRPSLRQNARFRALLTVCAALVAVELVLIPVYYVVLLSDFPPMSDF